MARPKNDGRGRLGGRVKGVPNKITGDLRRMLTEFSNETFQDFVDAFRQIKEPKDKCKLWLDAQAYVIPRLSSIDLQTSDTADDLRRELDDIAAETDKQK